MDLPVNADGTFEFTRVRPGNYQLMVSSGTLAQPIAITVGENDVRGLEVKIIPTYILTGTLTVEGNGVRPRFALTLSSLRGGISVPTTTVTTNGTFRLTLPESEYIIGWSGLPAGYHVKSIKAGTADLLSGTLKLSGASPDIAITLGVDEKPPWVKVSGRISGLSGVPNSSSLRVGLSGTMSIDPLEISVNPDGTFQFDRVLPGSYTAVLAPRLPIPATPVVVPNQDLVNVAITIPPLKEVRGTVTGQGFIPPLSFGLRDPSGGGLVSATVVVTPTTDGSFRVLIPEGDHRVTVNAAGSSVQSVMFGPTDLLRGPLKLSSTSTEELRVTLAPISGGVAGGVVGGVVGGVLGGVLSATNPLPGGVPPPPPPPPPLPPLQRIGGDVAQANLISSAPPVYPPLARAAQVRGSCSCRCRFQEKVQLRISE